MNKRLFSMALLMSALPFVSPAEIQTLQLNSGDFISSERLSVEGDPLFKVKLSKAGKAKLKRVQKNKF